MVETMYSQFSEDSRSRVHRLDFHGVLGIGGKVFMFVGCVEKESELGSRGGCSGSEGNAVRHKIAVNYSTRLLRDGDNAHDAIAILPRIILRSLFPRWFPHRYAWVVQECWLP